MAVYMLPLNEVVFDFYDRLKIRDFARLCVVLIMRWTATRRATSCVFPSW